MMRAQGRTRKGRTPQEEALHGAGVISRDFDEIMRNRPPPAWVTEIQAPRKKWKAAEKMDENECGLPFSFWDENENACWSDDLASWEDFAGKGELKELRGVSLIHGGDSGVGLKKKKGYDLEPIRKATSAVKTIRKANQTTDQVCQAVVAALDRTAKPVAVLLTAFANELIDAR